MKRRIVLLAVVIALIAGFGALLHSPPSVIDAFTGATPKAKKKAQLEGDYIFGINRSIDKLSSKSIRKQLKSFVSGKTKNMITDKTLSFDIYVSSTDYTLLEYVDSLCEKLIDSGVNAQVKQYSSTMLRSRVISGKYEVFLVKKELVSIDALENTDYVILDGHEMR